MVIEYRKTRDIDPEELLQLSASAGWKEHRTTERNQIAVEKSLYIAAAYEENKLVGIIRLVGDGAYILHIADMIVRKDYQSRGIGTQLLKMAFDFAKEIGVGAGKHLGEFTLMANVGADEFYKKAGFVPIPNGMVLADCPERKDAENQFQAEWAKEH